MRAFARRVVTVSLVLLLFGLALATAPLWIAGTLAFDLGARGRTALRFAAFLLWYLACEALGLLGIALTLPCRLAGPAAFRRANLWLQNAWARALFLGARATFRIRLEAQDAHVAEPGPILLLMRHATLVDTLVPTLSVAVPTGLDLRYVLKSELAWDPCLDIVGHRMGHVFAERGGRESEREAAKVAALAEGLGAGDGVMIYPEGTRFTSERRERVLARIRESGDAERLARAEALEHVLPPRLGGTLALLDAAPEADVVFCTHTGLEAATRLDDLWRGGALGRVLRARFWRVPREQVPEGAKERAAWLHAQWLQVDDWIRANRDA